MEGAWASPLFIDATVQLLSSIATGTWVRGDSAEPVGFTVPGMGSAKGAGKHSRWPHQKFFSLMQSWTG